jgi:hypothetical protein
MAKKKAGSDLLKALGKDKKAQMKVLYPGMSTASKSKNIGKKISKSKNVSSERAKVLRGPVAEKLRKSKSSKIGGKLKTAAAVGVGYAAAKANDKRKSAKASDKAKDAADKLLKKQKDKKKHHSK